MHKLIAAILMAGVSSVALAQTYPSPTFNNLTVTGTANLPAGTAANNGAVPHVANLTALRNYSTSYGSVVIRDGYANAGDAPAILYVWQSSCSGTPDNLALYVNAGDGALLVFADHNYFINYSAIAFGNGTVGRPIHFSSLSPSQAAQANGFKRASVSGFTTNTVARIRLEPSQTGNWIEQLDTYDPPALWTIDSASLNPFSCTTDQGTSCLPNTFAYLQTCNAATLFKEIPIIDSNVSTFGANITGSGANTVKAFCIPPNWTVH